MLQMIELIGSLVQSTSQPLYLLRDGMNTGIANYIPINQRSVPHLDKPHARKIIKYQWRYRGQ